MRLDPNTVAKLCIRFNPLNYLRLTPKTFAGTPLGMGFGQTRFASPTQSFRLLYLARNLDTAIAEAIVRDRFENATEREIDLSELSRWMVVEVSANRALTVLDLRNTGLLELGISTDAARAKAQIEGRRFSQAVYDTFDLDGLLYTSRLTGAECVAVYDRAVQSGLSVENVGDLFRLADLVPALSRLNVTVIRPR